MHIADFDSDGEPELRVLSRTQMFTMSDSRVGPGVLAGVAVRAVYMTMALQSQGDLVMHERYEDTEGGEPNESSEARVTYEDQNGDGHLDLAVHRFFAGAWCEAVDITRVSPNDSACDAHAARGVHYYNPASDRREAFVELEATRVEEADYE